MQSFDVQTTKTYLILQESPKTSRTTLGIEIQPSTTIFDTKKIDKNWSVRFPIIVKNCCISIKNNNENLFNLTSKLIVCCIKDVFIYILHAGISFPK